MRIGVLTSGGDAPGMNAAVHSIVRASYGRGHDIWGIRRGYAGLLEEDAKLLTLQDVDGISRHGGTMLGSARSPVFPTEQGLRQGAEQLRRMKLDGLIVIGGNGSLTGAHALTRHTDCRIIGLPASIDNDVGHSGLAIGVDTAVNTIVEACDRISDTARAHHRAFIVEVMGRNCGYLAMRAGIASEADAILFAERARSEDEIVEELRAILCRSFSRARNKKRVLILKAEGVKISTGRLRERLQLHLDDDVPGVDVRETILGHVVRGGNPSATDRVIAQRLGLSAVMALEQGGHDVMMGWDTPSHVGAATPDPNIRQVPLVEMIAETARLLDGSSDVTMARLKLLESAETLLSL